MHVVALLVSLWGVQAFSAPFYVDADGKPLSFERTICGSNDMVKMIEQSDAMKELGEPIGIYRGKTGGGASMCTGTLIDKDLFLTARHCAASCTGITVKFGYLEGSREEIFACKEIVEKGGSAGNDDYMIIRLEGNPGLAWGWYPLSDKELAPGQALMMIHHPSAKPMRVSLKDCAFKAESGGFLEHRCDTEGGSSGSGILVPDFNNPDNIRVVAVHALGGCTSSPTSSNSGPAIRHLTKKSALIRSLIR